jgi:xanthine dehydrogenase YagS FAD-binding subunit
MRPFSYVRATSTSQAIDAAANDSAKYLAGGTNLIDLVREDIEQPELLIDVTRLPLAGIEDLAEGGLRIGAMARNSAVANDLRIRRRYPMLARAILNGASAQIRNMATVGGNLMQRTRCLYFYDQAASCNKRSPGGGCDALGGFNRGHAILGASNHCIAVHPSDMCVALAALDAIVQIKSTDGTRRSIPLIQFHRLPEDTPHIETALKQGELVTAIDLPAPLPGHSAYVKVRDRASFAFALVSVAAQLQIDAGSVSLARLALGGVAHRPWRVQDAEELLVGASADQETYRQAAEKALADARPHHHNAFKIDLAKRLIVRVLSMLTADAGGGRL